MVRFENVGLRYGLGPEILRDLTFLIPAHSFQFLTGPSGAGKTSLLRMMATAIPPTSGRLRLLGRDPGSYRPRRELDSSRPITRNGSDTFS